MTTAQIKEYNCETQEEIIRDATDAEIAQMAIDAENAAARKTEAEAKAYTKTLMSKFDAQVAEQLKTEYSNFK